MKRLRSPRRTICQLLHSLTVGGAEVLAREYARRCDDQFNVVFACLDEIGTLGQQLRQAGYVVECLGRRPGLDFATARSLRRFCRTYSVDLIHAQQYTPFFYAALSRRWSRRPPILFTEHGRHFPDQRRPKRVLANRFLLRPDDQLVAVGNQVKRALVDNDGFAPDRVEVIYNGIDVNSFQADPQIRNETRRELQITDDQIAVFQIARLNPLKDHATALATWCRLADQPNIRLFLVGDGEQRAEIERLIESAGLQNTVSLLGTRNDVQRLITAADLCLLTSISEGIPLTLIEAMATEVPCIATDVGGVSEVVRDGETGLLAPVKDEAALARHVLRLANDPTLRRQMGRQARRRAESCFSDATMHQAYHRLYRRMTGQAVSSDPTMDESSQPMNAFPAKVGSGPHE